MSVVPEAPLSVIAEIGIAFIGFTGVIFMLSNRVQEEKKFRLIFLVLMATQVTFCALLPFGIEGFIEDEDLIWRIAISAFAITSLSFSAHALKGIVSGSLSTQTPVFRTILLVSGIVVGSTAALSALGIGFRPSHSLLVICLTWQILSVISLFVFTLQYLWREDSDDA